MQGNHVDNQNKIFETPVLFIAFARPHATKEVFEAIKKIRPKHLYIAADAPRSDDLDEIVSFLSFSLYVI